MVPRFPRRREPGPAALVELAGRLTRPSSSARSRAAWTIGQDGNSARGPFVYFLNEGHPGTVIEMAEATPTRVRVFDAVRAAAGGLETGKDPIRDPWPSEEDKR